MNAYGHEFMHITDVCLLLGVSAREVRRLCEEGKIVAYKKEGSAQLDIPSEQFKNHPNWEAFVNKLKERRKRNVKVCEIAKEMWKKQK